MIKTKPSLDEARQYEAEYKTVPISVKLKSDIEPADLMKKLKERSAHCYMLESSEDKENHGRYTFLGYDPEGLISAKNGEITIMDEFSTMHLHGDVRQYIDKMLKLNKSPRIDYLPTFTGGLVGYFGYDYKKYSEPKLQINAVDDGNFMDVDLMQFNKVYAFDHLKDEIILIANIKTNDIEKNYFSALKQLSIMANIIKTKSDYEPPTPELHSDFTPGLDKDEYESIVEKARDYIKEGDIFQVVLSNTLSAKMSGSLFSTYEVLKKINPSPYMFYFSSNDIEIAGASPETLVKLEGDNLFTYPLAGTRKRGKTKEEDDKLQKELLLDEKELAEHNMLVDLGRNDLGKISKFGSVKVEKYHEILKFSHVMHIGSTIHSKIQDGMTALDAIDSVLPAGTLSGAPKIRAMEIIDELEKSRRGIYGGAIGYIDFTGNMDTAIAIRIAYKKGDTVYVRSGAGIVADSVAENEHRECINKAMAVVSALKESAGYKE